MRAVECEGLHAAYNARQLNTSSEILKGVDFAVEEGRRLAILGENGCGKTTLLRAITDMIPTIGDVKLFGNDIKKMKRREIAKSCAMLGQLSQIYFSYTVRECVLMGRYIHSGGGFAAYSDEDMHIAEECMRRCGVYALAERQLNSLSGGEQQRAFLARCFAQDARILLLDEPTNHLDLKLAAELSEYLLEWSAERGHTLIGVYHDIPLALKLSEELLLIKNGKVFALGKKEEVLEGDKLEQLYDFKVRAYLREMQEYY